MASKVRLIICLTACLYFVVSTYNFYHWRRLPLLNVTSADSQRYLKKYNGREVRIQGYMYFAFEGTSIWTASGVRTPSSDAVWMSLDNEPMRAAYLAIRTEGDGVAAGILRCESGKGYGHLGAYVAELEDARVIQPPIYIRLIKAALLLTLAFASRSWLLKAQRKSRGETESPVATS